MITHPESSTPAGNPLTQDLVAAACRRIPPLWSLQRFVAVNPFLGVTDRSFLDAARLVGAAGHCDVLVTADYLLGQIQAGRICEADVQAALALARQALPPAWADRMPPVTLAELTTRLTASRTEASAERIDSFADWLDARTGSAWAAFVVEEISKWCSAYYDEGQSSWRMPWRDRGLFAAWQAAARLDANPEWSGLRGFRRFVAALPADPGELIQDALGRLRVPEKLQTDFLHRQLLSIGGWSSHAQYRARETGSAGQPEDPLAQLLAIRLAYDLALLDRFGGETGLSAAWTEHMARQAGAEPPISPGWLARFVAQQAMECGYQAEVIGKLKVQAAAPPPAAAPGRRALQAVFCIDVRSEVFRRALEAQSADIATLGFAGFFGIAIEYLRFGQPAGAARCPVLLAPAIKIRETPAGLGGAGEARLLRSLNFQRSVGEAVNAFKSSAISCFSFVETAGLWFGARLAKDALGLAAPDRGFARNDGRRRFAPEISQETGRPDKPGQAAATGIALADQINLAAGVLKHLGLTSGFAEVVLLCGHGSATANNPYGSALDCGACGGHAGDANARVAAGVLNAPAVRAGLRQRGIEIPADTVFLAGLHNTTTDEVLIYADSPLSASQAARVATIQGWLDAAARQARRERAASLGLAHTPDAAVDARIFARSRDWSEVRPEWGLAGNAAFIAAPRERTRGLNLGGRTFLHNYAAALDPDRATLELILTAPLVVASWINLQYYGSTVDNRRFGSGNKTLHNVVGTFGVWQGNGGDLQTGLPLQSVHDGVAWRHEPLRLSVFIEAPRADLAAILARQPGVRDLVENGWVHLFAIEDAGKKIYRHAGKAFASEPL